MTTGNETDPRDDALARAWRAQSQELPPPALDATILAAAHRAVGSGPRDARKPATEATRPQRWWMPLAAAATIGVVVIGILQIAPQAPVDIVAGERAEVAGRVASAPPATPAAPAKDMVSGSLAGQVQEAAPAKDMVSGNIVGQAREAAPAKYVEQAKAEAPMPATPTPGEPSTAMSAPVAREKRATPEAASAPPPPAAAAALTDARRQVAETQAAPQPEPFPADKLSSKVDTQSTLRQNERKDAGVAPSAPAPSMLAPAPMKKESAAGSLVAADNAAKPAPAARERDAARDEASARNVPAAAAAEQARGAASPAELQARARDPEAWVARIRKLRADGRVEEAVAELREFRRYVPDAETRLPADLRQLVPSP